MFDLSDGVHLLGVQGESMLSLDEQERMLSACLAPTNWANWTLYRDYSDYSELAGATSSQDMRETCYLLGMGTPERIHSLPHSDSSSHQSVKG